MSRPLTVTFEVDEDWPTPNHCRRAADAMDTLTPARYGAILRAYADAEDARFEEHGPYRAALGRDASEEFPTVVSALPAMWRERAAACIENGPRYSAWLCAAGDLEAALAAPGLLWSPTEDEMAGER